MKKTKFRIYALGLAGVLMLSMPAVVSADDAETIAALESEKTVLQEQVESLESEVSNLQKQLTALQTPETETTVEETEAAPAETKTSEKETAESDTSITDTYSEAEIVKAVQQALNDAGFDCGTPDGLSGSKTVNAINAYAKANNIATDGKITEELIETLGVAKKLASAAQRDSLINEYSASYTYKQIARSPKYYTGKKVCFRGEVLQEGAVDDSTRYIRLAVDSDYDSVLFITYEENLVDMKILERDLLTVYGDCSGEYTYESALGVKMTLPYLTAVVIDMSEVQAM